jgi:hypothetical protein
MRSRVRAEREGGGVDDRAVEPTDAISVLFFGSRDVGMNEILHRARPYAKVRDGMLSRLIQRAIFAFVPPRHFRFSKTPLLLRPSYPANDARCLCGNRYRSFLRMLAALSAFPWRACFVS